MLLLFGEINKFVSDSDFVDHFNMKSAFLAGFSNSGFSDRFIGLLATTRQEIATRSRYGSNLAVGVPNYSISAWAQMILCTGVKLSKLTNEVTHLGIVFSGSQ